MKKYLSKNVTKKVLVEMIKGVQSQGIKPHNLPKYWITRHDKFNYKLSNSTMVRKYTKEELVKMLEILLVEKRENEIVKTKCDCCGRLEKIDDMLEIDHEILSIVCENCYKAELGIE